MTDKDILLTGKYITRDYQEIILVAQENEETST